MALLTAASAVLTGALAVALGVSLLLERRRRRQRCKSDEGTAGNSDCHCSIDNRSQLHGEGRTRPMLTSSTADTRGTISGNVCRPLRERLSVVLTTSAVPSHPSSVLLDDTLCSMDFAVGLSACSLLIVCDGYKLCPHGAEPRFRAGVLDLDSAQRYEDYKRQLRLREVSNEFRLLELRERHGFGFAVRAALERVETPYVMVMQHDRRFMRRVEMEPLIEAMEAHPWLKYLGMPTTTTLRHQSHVLSKYGLRIEAVELDGCDLRAMPLLQWYDSAHIGRTDYYRSFVFGPRQLVARGGFIEDKLGQQQLKDIRSHGLNAHAEYGTFVLDDGRDEPIVAHVDGRDSRHLLGTGSRTLVS